MKELKMMAAGGSVDCDNLTAEQEHVREGDIFFGAGSENEQTGTLVDRAKVIGGMTLDGKPIHQADSYKVGKDSNGEIRIAVVPPKGDYPGGIDAYVGVTPNDIGITPEEIANGETVCGVEGTYGEDGNIEAKDIRAGKIGYNANGRVIGEAAEYGNISKTIGAGESFKINEGIYGSGKITAKDLASQTGADAGYTAAANAQILAGYQAWSDGIKRNGSMVNRGAVAPAALKPGDSYFIPEGYHNGSGKITAKDLASQTGADAGYTAAANAQILAGYQAWSDGIKRNGSMVNRGAVAPAALNPGGSYTIPAGYHNGSGKVTAKQKYIKHMAVNAVRGFSASSSSYVPGPYEESFTMPAAGTVYYDGIFAAYNGSGNGVCEIYKNGTLVDSRNGGQGYTWRTTMIGKSFSASAGDTIKIRASATSGTATLSQISAVIEYFA